MKGAIVSSPNRCWVWIVAIPMTKKRSNLFSPMILPAGKESTKVPGGNEERDLIITTHSFTSLGALRTCTPWAGLWKATKHPGGSCTAYGKEATGLKTCLPQKGVLNGDRFFAYLNSS